MLISTQVADQMFLLVLKYEFSELMDFFPEDISLGASFVDYIGFSSIWALWCTLPMPFFIVFDGSRSGILEHS